MKVHCMLPHMLCSGHKCGEDWSVAVNFNIYSVLIQACRRHVIKVLVCPLHHIWTSWHSCDGSSFCHLDGWYQMEGNLTMEFWKPTLEQARQNGWVWKGTLIACETLILWVCWAHDQSVRGRTPSQTENFSQYEWMNRSLRRRLPFCCHEETETRVILYKPK